jgi:hypothetical protein
MLALRAATRSLLVAVLLLIGVPLANAQTSGTKLPSHTNETSRGPAAGGEQLPAGNPFLGVLIIIGIIGFLIFVAWLFSRVGEGSGRSDGTLN